MKNEGRGGQVVRCELWSRKVPNPIPPKIRRVLDLLHVKSHVGGQTLSRWRGAEVWREIPAQKLSSSSDRGSKLRGSSRNSPRVALKLDGNIIKTKNLNQ
ncbi:hypothetical protein AVEN_116741-1 [Araneus ventricosus]|uniref:Uncharacterized protein n=1 Tax=Araneus ventricosus TaxID=182803 RepID=A0A4Y2SBG4_ARAVE|nr:hypothetical protein AVEN_113551-1 [Araneus ventricosus]GBN84637.1 hypothetical protein AVEN_116741-1 [Araneus ventricosus]